MKCTFCDARQSFYYVTELKNGKVVETFQMCADCGREYMKSVMKELEPEQTESGAKVMTITTPEQLLNFLDQLSLKTGVPSKKKPCPRCGWTVKDFQTKGRFGCPDCYDHFSDEFDAVVVPYQKADEHNGKRPKRPRHVDESPEEQLKTLKLRLAKAVEIEDYESAALLKQQLKTLNPSPPE